MFEASPPNRDGTHLRPESEADPATTVLLHHLAGIINAIDTYDDDRAWEAIDDAATPVCAALNIDPSSSWPDIATAIRARAAARTTGPAVPGLPNGWEWGEDGCASDGMTHVAADDDGLWIDGRFVPASVVRAALARMEVAS